MYFEIDRLNELREALKTLCTGLMQQHVPQDSVYDSKLVADELLSNALRHGGGKIFFGIAQVGVDRQGHVHGSFFFFHLHGGEARSVQERSQFPIQGEVGE